MSSEKKSAGPLDRDLLRLSPPARKYILGASAIGVVLGAADLALAISVGWAVATLVGATTPWTFSSALTLIWPILAAVVVRTLMTYVRERYSNHHATVIINDLRSQSLNKLAHSDPRQAETMAHTWRPILTSGLETLRPYLTQYIPQLIAAVIITPAALLIMLYVDWVSGLIAVFTIPLIPLFMILIGFLTQKQTKKKLEDAAYVEYQLTDLIAGLPTLQVYGRQKQPIGHVKRAGERLQKSTMGVLRIAFMSSFALELLATISVALIAVEIGVRLVAGSMTLMAGLISLTLAPEVYLPLRKVGASFHAASDGVEATSQVYAVLGSSEPQSSVSTVPVEQGVRLENVSIHGRDGYAPADLSLTAQPGQVVALTGANGTGKSTALYALMGLVPVAQGSVKAPNTEHMAWLPTRPELMTGTLQQNLELYGGKIDSPEMQQALIDAGFAPVLEEHGADYRIQDSGLGLSLGQRQRLGLARVFAQNKPIMLLDEPTAHLDPDLSKQVAVTLQNKAREGATVVIISHAPDVLTHADTVVEAHNGQ